jgi:outer membrane immunogenic protein
MVLVAASLGSPVLAADLPLKAPPPVVAAYNWTGCYLGASAGANAGRTDGFVTTPATVLPERGFPLQVNPGVNATGPFDLPPGVIAGGFGGCNYQFAGHFVIGGEVDWSYTNKAGFAKLVPNGIVLMGFGNVNDLWSLREKQLATARLRLGYAVTDRWLLYVTGGGAWAEVESFETITTNPTPPETALQTHWRNGWTVGAGTEYAVGRGWSVRAEFLYVDLGKWTTFTNISPTGIPGSDTFTSMNVNLRDYIGRVGLSYKFDWPMAAVVARY